MKKIKQRVTFKKRRRNKMRHSHKMQRGGIVNWMRKKYIIDTYEKKTAREIMNLTDDTRIDYLIIIADKNLKGKMERDAKTILERTKNSWTPTNFKNWVKGDMRLDNEIMEYFNAYNKISQILTSQKINQLKRMNENDPRINDVSEILYEFFCKYIDVISKVLKSIQEQKTKNLLLKMLYEHLGAGSFKKAIKDTRPIDELNTSLSEGIQYYNIKTNEIELGDPRSMISQLNNSIRNNDHYISTFQSGITNAKKIIASLGKKGCLGSVVDSSANVVASSANVVASGNNINSSSPVVDSMQENKDNLELSSSISTVLRSDVNTSNKNQDDDMSVREEISDSDGLEIPLNKSELSLLETAQNIPGKSIENISLDKELIESLAKDFLQSIDNKYDITTKSKEDYLKIQIYKWLQEKDPMDPYLKIKTKKIFDNIYQKLSPKEEAELASGIKAIKEGRSLLDSNGGKRNRNQRGGGKEEIVASLEQFNKDVAAQLEKYKQQPPPPVSIVEDRGKSSSIRPGEPDTIRSRELDNSVSVSRYDQPQSVVIHGQPQPVMIHNQPQQQQGQQQGQQKHASLEDIIRSHDEANARQTEMLITQFEKLQQLISGNFQGQSRGIGQENRDFQTPTGYDTNVLTRSDSGSANAVVNNSVSEVDLSKLTSDSYAQTVRYLKLFKAIVEKRGEQTGEEEAKEIIEKIDAAIETLQDIAKQDGFVNIDEATKEKLNAPGADIASIMFSLLGFGTGFATLGGKRKCKRKTLKRMKKYKKGRPGRNTKKRYRKKNRS